jgi:hypothetical protein
MLFHAVAVPCRSCAGVDGVSGTAAGGRGTDVAEDCGTCAASACCSHPSNILPTGGDVPAGARWRALPVWHLWCVPFALSRSAILYAAWAFCTSAGRALLFTTHLWFTCCRPARDTMCRTVYGHISWPAGLPSAAFIHTQNLYLSSYSPDSRCRGLVRWFQERRGAAALFAPA